MLIVVTVILALGLLYSLYKNVSQYRALASSRKRRFELLSQMLLGQIRIECEYYAHLHGLEVPSVKIRTFNGTSCISIRYDTLRNSDPDTLLAVINLDPLMFSEEIYVLIYTLHGIKENRWTIEGSWSPRKMVWEDLSDYFIPKPSTTAASA